MICRLCYLVLAVSASCVLAVATAAAETEAAAGWRYSATPCEGQDDSLALSFLNVGQGDATLIRCPAAEGLMLIDGGPANKDYPGAEQLFETALRRRLGPQQRLDIVVLSHPHPDHSFGILSVFETMKLAVGRYIDNAADNSESDIEERIRQIVVARGIEYQSLGGTLEQDILLCPSGPAFKFIQPQGEAARDLGCPENLNDCSIVTSFSYGGLHVALMADATRRWEKRALASRVTVLPSPLHVMKVGHHGAGAPSEAFLERTSPSLAIISSGEPSVGTTKRRGYPKYQSLEVLEKNARKQAGAANLPHYRLAGCTFVDGACRWTNTVVPTTLLATASLGSLDVYLRPGHLCAMGEHLRGSLHFTFPHETLASDLE